MSEHIKQFPEVEKWLRGKSEGTQRVYLSGMRAYLEFTKMNPTELIDEAEKDRDQKVRHRGKPEGRVMDFQRWLLKKYKQKTRGGGRNDRNTVGISEKLASTYCMSIRSFYKTNGFRLGEEGAEFRLKKTTKVKANSKLQLRADEVKRMLDVCSRLRDRAIILFMYQGFQAVGEICSINYGDVQRDLESGADILTIEMIRKKSKTEYFTCVGDEAIGALELYLNERVRNGDVLKYESPLFTKEGKTKSEFTRVTPGIIENFFKDIALKSGLVSEERMEKASMNPARPHSLRSSGMTVAKLSGMAEVQVEFMSGHSLDDMTQAYWQARPEELTQKYLEHYHSLRVLKPKLDEKKVKQLETRVMKRDDVIDALIENGKMKDEKIGRLNEKVESLEQSVTKLNARFEHFSASMNLSPEEMTALGEIITKYMRGLDEEDFKRQQKEDDEQVREIFKNEEKNR